MNINAIFPTEVVTTKNTSELPKRDDYQGIVIRYPDGYGHNMSGSDYYYVKNVDRKIQKAQWNEGETKTTLYILNGKGGEDRIINYVDIGILDKDCIFKGSIIPDDQYANILNIMSKY